MIFHRHYWQQILNATSKTDEGNEGAIFFCVHCSAIHIRTYENCPNYIYPKKEVVPR